MDILLVSTFRQPCGIATYSEYLTDALLTAGHRVCISAECIGAEAPTNMVSPYTVRRTWQRGWDYTSNRGLSSILSLINSGAAPPAVVHIQHEFGIFPNDGALILLLTELQQRNIPSVITLHTAPRGIEHHRFLLELRHLAQVVVHTPVGSAAIGGGNVIPHGVLVRSVENPIKTEARARLVQQFPLVQDHRILLCPGFLSPTKKTEEIIDAFAQALSRQQTTMPWLLAIVGKAHRIELADSLSDEINWLGIQQNAIIVDGFQPASVMNDWFLAADAAILGGQDRTPYSASGQMATAMGYGLPVIAKNTDIYLQPGGIIYYYDAGDCGRWIESVLSSHVLRQHLRTESMKVALDRSWDEIARRHVELYRSLAG